MRQVDPISMFLVASVIVWLAVGLVENQLTDRYIYFPVAAIAAIAVRHQGGRTRPAPTRRLAIGMTSEMHSSDAPASMSWSHYSFHAEDGAGCAGDIELTSWCRK